VLAAVVELLGAQWPWLLLIVGMTLIAISVFLAAPSTVNWFSPVHLYRYRKRRKEQKQQYQYEQKQKQERQKFLKDHLPTYIIHEPVINTQPINPKDSLPQHTGKFKIEITNRPDCIEPIEVHFKALITLEQEYGYGSLSMDFWMQPRIPNATIPLRETREYTIDMIGTPSTSNPPFLDLSKCYHWKIEGVTLYVNGLQEQVKCHSEGDINGEEKSV